MFFRLAVALRLAGTDLFEIESTLQSAAAFARNPAERRAQIPSIMNSLNNRRGL
jgi:hypothetical protein